APACGGCAEGFADEGGVCVPFVPATCEADAPGSILAACQAQQRACVAGDVEAACGECLQGFASRDGAQVCEPAVLCAALGCGDLGRVCEGEPFAACGACEPGAVEENPGAPGGRCVRRLACEDIACLEGQFCIEGDVNTDAVCSDRPCPEGQALRAQGVGGVCVDCAIQCGETGETGETYPYTRQDSDECICETRTGFYADVAGAVRALPCDEDGDGWVRLSARSALESEDPTIQANARCPLREIDRFELRNQHGQTREILSCVEGLQPAEAGPCQQLSPVGLYESVRNDSPIELARANVADVPPVVSAGGAGRALRAEELNSLVRYCVSANADYNDNLTSDLNEHHGQQPAAELDAALAPFVAMSYFGELATGAWQAPAEGQPFGRYVIAERSRCGDEFALGYAPGEGENWRGCTLNRDAAFDAGLSQVGFDFARFGCDAATGTCPLAPPVTSPRPAPGVIQPHGLCEVALPPADGIWRGMNLHSQFKCVAVVAPEALPQDRRDAPQLVTVDELYDGQVARRKLQLNRCAVACPAGDAGCALDCEGERCATSSREGGVLANPAEPVLTCTPSTGADAPLAVGDVGFAAVRYDNVDGAYRRGCINEWDPSAVPAEGTAWRALCPGYDAAPDRVVGQANTGNFGTIMCGCGLSYGGAGCRLGCPEALADLDGDGSLESDVGGLHYGGPAANQGADCANGYCPVQGRRGYWVCGGFNATTLEADDGSPDVGVLEGGDYLLLGGVTAQPAEGDTLCEHDDCAQGYRLRAVDFTDRLP
ncbi:MAG: hypothetical protein KC560_16740, partial [Myxococcales bacterium]|nr:hypothetical protein [Myxococcales bacterium]